ncbi:circadian clock protein KaiC [Actinoplanes octamycinicus]|uniref:non-specific serine/threonine protein kinase n=1 Tax=Actinoplanes octamycinicus TaxID=135948 RepID=A0A7W7M9L2_9ACTN|nr:ATPase domain-containing protein [Actinoplanes octamycinicus]MBB4742037.1 circadian clock protein KaiC [Actinoplanes octamycinicus]GIE60801.1 serine/threonine protein kinase [Actinoplanes octamycinicus]
MPERRLTSGQDRFDAILGGGLIDPSIALIAGLPGSGKTVLAQQYAFANGTDERPAIYLSTVAEPLSKILYFGEALSFFDPDRVGRSVLFEDLGGQIDDNGLVGALRRISGLVERQPCSVLIIDSFRALRYRAAGEREFEGFVHQLAGQLAASGTMALWLGEYRRDELEGCPEFAVADAAVLLATEDAGQRDSRALRVLKLRGSDFRSGAHAYRIENSGIRVFPRLSDVDAGAYELGERRTTSGIAALDMLVGEGYWPGSATLVIGPSGSGKTVMGLQFVYGGAKLGEPGVYASMQENRVQLTRMINGFGWGLDDHGAVLRCDSPNDIYIDQWYYDLLDTIKAAGARRLVIDSLGDLAAACPDEKRFREFVYALLNHCSRAGISVLLTFESAELYGHTSLSERGVSHLSDNVILLQYVRNDVKVGRALTVLKTRASQHVPQSHEFEITHDGIDIKAALDTV